MSSESTGFWPLDRTDFVAIPFGSEQGITFVAPHGYCKGSPLHTQKGEEFPLMPPQSFEESFGISILIRVGQELVQPTIQSLFQALVNVGM